MSTVVQEEIREVVPLTASDRCDRCSAQAKMRATLKTGTLLFCRHHGQEHLPKLVEVAVDVFVEPLDK
jgi:hypothetical protein